MKSTCKNCESQLGGMFGAISIDAEQIQRYQKLIECPNDLCNKCAAPYIEKYNTKKFNQPVNEKISAEKLLKIRTIPLITVSTLPQVANYKFIDIINFQSTLGTGLFSEIDSSLSNIFGTESDLINEKMSNSLNKCKDALRALAFELGGNAVIGVDFSLSTNSKDATTVAAQGTAVYIENIGEIFTARKPSK